MRDIKKWVRANRSNQNTKKKTWKEYKRFFLWKKKIHYWNKFKHFYNNIRVFKKYYLHMNALKSTSTINNYQRLVFKKSFNKSYSFLHQLHFRLHLVLVHSHFATNKFEGLGFIKNGLVVVNNKIIIQPNYILNIQDLIYLFTNNLKSYRLCFNNFFSKKKFLVRIKHKRFYRCRRFKYKYFKRCLLNNFFEISYHTRSLVYLRILRNIELKKKIKKCSKFINIFNFKLVKKFWAFN